MITVDQFEEVFTLAEPADREALVANLAEFLESDRGHRVILTVREEFRSRIVELQAAEPFFGHRVVLDAADGLCGAAGRPSKSRPRS